MHRIIRLWLMSVNVQCGVGISVSANGSTHLSQKVSRSLQIDNAELLLLLFHELVYDAIHKSNYGKTRRRFKKGIIMRAFVYLSFTRSLRKFIAIHTKGKHKSPNISHFSMFFFLSRIYNVFKKVKFVSTLFVLPKFMQMTHTPHTRERRRKNLIHISVRAWNFNAK